MPRLPLALLEPQEEEVQKGYRYGSAIDPGRPQALDERIREGAEKMNGRSAAVRKGKWIELNGSRLAERIGLIIKALGIRRRGPDYVRVFGRTKDAIWRYRSGRSRPRVNFIVRLHRLEEIYAKEIKRMREAEYAYGGFKKIPTEVLESLWARANKGLAKD